MAQLHQILRHSNNHAVSDHTTDLEVVPSPEANGAHHDGSRYFAELRDVQDQSSSRVQHRLNPVKQIRIRSEQKVIAVVDSTFNEGID